MSAHTRESCNTLHVLDVEKREWSTGPAPNAATPSPRCHHAAAVLPGSAHWVVMGGVGGQDGKTALADVHLFDLERWRWTVVEFEPGLASPAPRGSHTLNSVPASQLTEAGDVVRVCVCVWRARHCF